MSVKGWLRQISAGPTGDVGPRPAAGGVRDLHTETEEAGVGQGGSPDGEEGGGRRQ